MATVALLIGSSPFLHGNVLQLLYSGQILLIVLSKLPQIRTLLQTQDSGSLSITTVALTFAGSCARVITSVVEKGGATMVLNYTVAVCFNLLLLVLAVYYAPGKKDKTK